MAEELKQTAMEIVVDDGSQRIPIKNNMGEEMGVFYFRPTDIGLIQRYNDFVTKFSDILTPLQEVTISPDGTVDIDDDTAVKALDEAEKRLFEACDYMLGGNMSEAFFGKMHPFSPIGGVFYCEIVLGKVGEFIAKQFDAETKKIDKRLSRYVGKYQKGKK